MNHCFRHAVLRINSGNAHLDFLLKGFGCQPATESILLSSVVQGD